MPTPKNLKNTWKVADVYFEELGNGTDSALELFESSWKALNSQVDEYNYMAHRHDPNDSKLQLHSPLDIFLNNISEGVYPSPEVLFTIAKCFNHYFNSQGKAELEDIFFGVSPEKGTGNYSAQRGRHKRFSTLSFWEGMEAQGAKRMKRKQRPLPTLIEEDIFLSNLLNEDEDIDSFLRSYRRWKKATNTKLEDLDEDELELYFQRFLF